MAPPNDAQNRTYLGTEHTKPSGAKIAQVTAVAPPAPTLKRTIGAYMGCSLAYGAYSRPRLRTLRGDGLTKWRSSFSPVFFWEFLVAPAGAWIWILRTHWCTLTWAFSAASRGRWGGRELPTNRCFFSVSLLFSVGGDCFFCVWCVDNANRYL